MLIHVEANISVTTLLYNYFTIINSLGSVGLFNINNNPTLNLSLLTGLTDMAYFFQPYNSEVIVPYLINSGSQLIQFSVIDFLKIVHASSSFLFLIYYS